MYFRTLLVSLAWGLLILQVASAQQVVVKNKPGEGQWTISYSRKHAPEVFELHTGCKTLAAAKAEVQKLIAWSNSMDANSSWRLAVIELEGEDAQSPNSDGPKLPGWLEIANDFRAQLNEKLPVLEDYMSQIAGAYERAKQAKEGLLKMQGNATKDVFDRVNGAISEYNKQLDVAQASPQGTSFSRFPRMTPVGPEVLQKAEEWRKAKQGQFELEEKKEKLDGEKARLDAERERVIREGRDMRAEEQRIKDLEKSMSSGGDGSLVGPFTLFTGQYSNTRGSKNGEFESFMEARAVGRRHMSQNASKQPNYRIVDKNGTDIEYDGLFGKKSVSEEQLASSANPQKSEASQEDKTNLARLKEEYAKRKATRNKAIERYKSELNGYNRELQEYEATNRSHKVQSSALSKFQYNAPAGRR